MSCERIRRTLSRSILLIFITVTCVTSALYGSLAFADAIERVPICEPKNNFNNLPIVWSGGYADMPYMTKLPDGRVGMVITVGAGSEGAE